MTKSATHCAMALLFFACSASSEQPTRPDITPTAPAHPVEIVTPLVLRGLPMSPQDEAGVETVTPCSTCHGAEDPSPLPPDTAKLKGPHGGLALRHGSLRCAACHDDDRRDQLHLADGRLIPLVDAMDLCAQCHGPQKRDYDHGAHGGMRGYWDLSRGPRERNHCVSCHDPHAPAFGKFLPVAGPRDRFTSRKASLHE